MLPAHSHAMVRLLCGSSRAKSVRGLVASCPWNCPSSSAGFGQEQLFGCVRGSDGDDGRDGGVGSGDDEAAMTTMQR